MRSLTVLFLVLSFGPKPGLAQGTQRAAADSPAFDVASVKQNTGGDNRTFYRVTPGGLYATNIQLQSLIMIAYGIDDKLAQFLVRGGTSSRSICTENCSGTDQVLRARFDITARAPTDLLPGRERQMLRTLLTERFKLRAHVEPRAISVYALTIARDGRLGPQIRASRHDCNAWQRARASNTAQEKVPEPQDEKGRGWCTMPFHAESRAMTIRYAGEIWALIDQIQSGFDRPIVDRTGLTGTFEWELTHAPIVVGIPSSNLETRAPVLSVALGEQLGLRLMSQTAVRDVLVIESVEMPAPN
ncbi:MAG TPA: TIGR03435 family protein [Vicinamibacterales bacterium]|nr:TIGR03435 family protein [Vicinamibacterales bacterium]